MDFALTEIQQDIRKSIQKLCKSFPREYWREKDALQEFPYEFWKELAQAGWLGIAVPEKYGGSGLGMTEMAVMIQELAACGSGSVSAFLLILTPVFGGITINKYGTQEQKEKYLAMMVSGEAEFALALTEPDAGSNSFDIKTFAKKEENIFFINGQKAFISGVDRASSVIVAARTTQKEKVSKSTHGISLFIIDLDKADGVEFKPIDKCGINLSKTSMLYLDDVEVSIKDLIGELDGGWPVLVDTLNAERIVAAAGCIGAGELAMKMACQYATEREVFDRPIGSNQGIQFPLAALKAELEAVTMLMYKATWLYDQDMPCAIEADMSKYLAGDIAWRIADQAMQTFGGYGYAKEYDIERLWRDLRLFRIGPVSQEMSLSFIAHHALRMPRAY